LSVTSDGDTLITIYNAMGDGVTEKENTHRSTLSRLSRKRMMRRNNNSKKSFRGRTKQSLSMMTRDDKNFIIDDFAVRPMGERFVGILSGPEHVGRFG